MQVQKKKKKNEEQKELSLQIEGAPMKPTLRHNLVEFQNMKDRGKTLKVPREKTKLGHYNSLN